MAETTNYDYLRVRISGKLTAKSLLHCGSGDFFPAKAWKSDKAKGEKGQINAVCKALDHKAYIPASTLRGSLRDRCPATTVDRIFGNAHGSGGTAGKVRIYDARHRSTPPDADDLYRNSQSQTRLYDGVSIDPITHTAGDHLLFCHEVVPTGTQFDFVVEADRVKEEDLRTLLELLCGWNGAMHSAIGKGRSKGWGKLQWGESTTIEMLTDEAVKSWVNGADIESPQWTSETIKTSHVTGSNAVTFRIRPTAPLLVNDHSRVSEEKGEPKLEFMRTRDGQAIIPGSSLRGAVRAQAHRVLASIAHQHFGSEASDAAMAVKRGIDELFGEERFRSPVWISDTIANKTTQHPQFFNAVDRFTGGVADSALYNVVAAECDYLSGECAVADTPDKLLKDDWWKGLLLLLVRDFMEGDFVVGWGKGRGYGAGRLSILLPDGDECKAFTHLLAYLQDYDPRMWINLLHAKVKHLLSEERSETA